MSILVRRSFAGSCAPVIDNRTTFSSCAGILQPAVELHSNDSNVHAAYCTRSCSPHNVVHSYTCSGRVSMICSN